MGYAVGLAIVFDHQVIGNGHWLLSMELYFNPVVNLHHGLDLQASGQWLFLLVWKTAVAKNPNATTSFKRLEATLACEYICAWHGS